MSKTNYQYPLVAVVVPVHNNKEDTAEFLESLKSVTYPNYKIIIVDDGSTDGTEEMIKTAYPEVILLKGDGNLWWSRAVNLGIEKALEICADYVLLIDNDCVVDSGFMSALVETALRNPRSIIVSKVLYYDHPNKIWEAGADINWFKGEYVPIGHGEIDKGQYQTERYVKCSTLVGALIDVTIFKEMGLMDYKNFPQFKADIDFTYRAYKRGYSIIYQPKSQVWHKVDSTIRKKLPKTSSFRSTFIYLTKDMRSPMNFNATIKYYLRHCPFYFLPLVLLKYFAVLLLKSWQHNPLYLDRKKIPFLQRKS
ncbi:putative glycosyltransferase [Archaeoglobus sulfaticallidus PM70-1]|uniref:Putative glycosyltransferase n=1 Tax=Archaeoglobus sulfaticallidus PM70-1 TaxID=387631 RepID=N0BAQ9_9EURY|nr:glycosyltransferase family 2 protein [Archaeoglobus sulfaticallidus]AGK60078.1 putative glycosyltransferase [Archaeoglobus sulfaticallidus PM70-1]